MSLFTSLNGVPVTRAKWTIPLTGIWHADVWLDRVSDVSGPQSLLVSGMTGTCSVLRKVDFAGETMLRLVGGKNGWSKTVPPAFYTSPNLSTVLGSVASGVGELVNVVTDRSIDPFYAVDGASPASSVLTDLLGDAWYMDLAGTIQSAQRSATTVASPFNLRAVEGAPGVYHVESDTIADWQPGAAFSCPTGSGVVSRVTHMLDAGKLRTEIMVPTDATMPADRLRAQVEAIIAAYLPNLLYFATWAYTVVSAKGGPSKATVDANPTDPRMPPVVGLPVRADASGSVATPAVGSTILVGFVGGDRFSPEIRSLDGSSPPTAFWIGQGTNPIARLGDQVQVNLPPGMPVVVTVSGASAPGVITAAAVISGVITQGSTIGKCK